MMYLPFTHPLATTTDFVVQRQLQITYDDDCPACYRRLHESQADLPDEALQCFPCIFQDDFALITEGHILDPVLEEQCNDIGLVRAVCYSIFSSPGMQHVADTYTAESAEQLVSLLTQTAIMKRHA